jgi:hypothetical protein
VGTCLGTTIMYHTDAVAWTALRLRHKTSAWASTCMCAISREDKVDSIQ